MASTSSNAESLSQSHTDVCRHDAFLARFFNSILCAIDLAIISALSGFNAIPPHSAFTSPFDFSILVTLISSGKKGLPLAELKGSLSRKL